MTPEKQTFFRGFLWFCVTRPGRWLTQNFEINGKIKEFIAMLRNGDGNKSHIECFSPVPQHRAQISGERTDAGTAAIHVGRQAAGSVP